MIEKPGPADFAKAWQRQGQEEASIRHRRDLDAARKAKPTDSERQRKKIVLDAEHQDRQAAKDHQRNYLRGMQIANGQVDPRDHD